MLNFLELADYLVAGVTLAIGLGVGRRMRPKPPEALKPICSCAHGYGTHEDGARCHAEVLVRTDNNGTKQLMPCPCHRYDGPDVALFGLAP